MIIQADLHTHTIASTHAYSTITENCLQAKEIGLKAIAMTDHGYKMPDSPHEWHFGNMKILPRTIHGVTVLKGAEVNIYNYNGDLDLTNDELAKLEWVVASYHKYTFPNFAPADPKTVTDGYLKAIRNPYIDVIGHPTTDFFPFEHERAIKAFKEYDKLVEINESSIKRKPGAAKTVVPVLQLCKRFEVPVVLNSDAHFWTEVGTTPVAEQILKDVDFPTRLIANSDWDSLRERILKKRPHLDI